MAKIFISYSSKNKAFARRLSEDLNRMGHEPWLDEWAIKVGECIITKIDRGIADSDFVVIILSSHSVKSGWVEKEWKTKYWYEIDIRGRWGRYVASLVMLRVLDILFFKYQNIYFL